MKTLLFSLALIMGTSSLSAANTHNDNCRHRFMQTEPTHHNRHVRDSHSVRVISSRPIYKKIIKKRDCRPADRYLRINNTKGVRITSKPKIHPQRSKSRCHYIDKQLVGYKNIAYWHGQRVVRISQRPLRHIVPDRREQTVTYRY